MTAASDRSSVAKTQRGPQLVAALCVLGISVAVLLIVSGSASAGPPIEIPRRVASWPHDPRAFTQGLAFHNGRLLEGTGRYRQSTLREVDVTSGQVKVRVALADNHFGEGIAVNGDEILQLTWRAKQLIVYDAKTLQQKSTVSYARIDPSLREGWGITFDGTHLIISDGSHVLRFVDPSTWKTVRKMQVKSARRSVTKLNELEFVNGEILANIWYSTRIARIDPQTGDVTGWLELRDIRPGSIRQNHEAVLNGIAWDDTQQRLYVTGKLWPEIFEITYTGLPAPVKPAP